MKYVLFADFRVWTYGSEVLESREKDVIFICQSNNSSEEEMPTFGNILKCELPEFSGIAITAKIIGDTIKSLDTHRNELLKMIGGDDVAVLSNENPVTLAPYLLLRNSTDCFGELHLIGIRPFEFMRRETIRTYNIFVRDLHGTRSAAFFDSRGFLSTRMTIPIGDWLQELLMELGELLRKLEDMGQFSKDKVYCYDFNAKAYLEVQELRYPF